MFMLKRLGFAPDLFTMASIDAATSGSETQMMVNIWESASILDPWENVYATAKANLRNYGYEVDDEVAEAQLKHYYQTLRHGMSFDWPLNYAVSLMEKAYPFSRHFKFPHTDDFINAFANDGVFLEEIVRLEEELQPILDWVFEDYPERTVYQRLNDYSGQTYELETALEFVRNNPPADPFVIPVETMTRTNYLVLLMEMISISIGHVKREFWTNRIFGIRDKHPAFEDCVIVSGGKFKAFAYGDLDGNGACWHKLENGIKALGLTERNQRKEYVRAFPDEMSFFRFDASTLYLDETLFPKVALDDGPWLTTNDFRDTLDAHPVVLNQPMRLRVKYDFKQDEKNPKIVKIKSNLNCLVKDSQVALNSEGVGETQIVFNSTKISFKVSDVDKQYPFTMFTTSKISSDSFEWL